MNVIKRNNINIIGEGEKVILLAHGYGCSQKMWRLVTPSLEKNFRLVLMDHVGSGDSDSSFYDRVRYGTLNGYAKDIIEILMELEVPKVIFVGHSVSSMIGVLAAKVRPELFSKLILVTPSPCYINQGDYLGGFTKDEMEGHLQSLESNFFEWSRVIAPIISGNDLKVSQEIAQSFCANRPDIAKHFARVTYLSDNRADVGDLRVPSVILQCSKDQMAPEVVGQYLHHAIPESKMIKLKAHGHCPHLTNPEEFIEALLPIL